jgi:hypothetical protein
VTFSKADGKNSARLIETKIFQPSGEEDLRFEATMSDPTLTGACAGKIPFEPYPLTAVTAREARRTARSFEPATDKDQYLPMVNSYQFTNIILATNSLSSSNLSLAGYD